MHACRSTLEDPTIRLAKTIKADPQLQDTRLVMMLPVGRHAEAQEARQAGVAMCLTKPVRQSALHDCLISVMATTGEVAAPLEGSTSGVALPRHRGGRLLLAEDNPVNQEVALGILSIEGCDVTVAQNGREVIEMYTKGNFDLVLMDCHMPEMDGFEATRKIRDLEEKNNLPRMPIIALTANAMQQDRDECLEAGMDDHLSKPYSRMQMRAMLERWLPLATDEAAPAAKPAAEAAAEPTVEPARADDDQAIAVLDPAALDAVRSLQSSRNPDPLGRLIGLYTEDAPELIQKMKHAAESGDAKAVAETAHTLKSTSGNIGASELAEVCRQIQDMARGGIGSELKALVPRVEKLYGAVQRALEVEQSRAAGKPQSA